MELMSSLLLCALVVLLPQTLGKTTNRRRNEQDGRVSLLSSQQKRALHKQLLLNINGPPLVNNVTELQTVFSDVVCEKCHVCMERAIKAHKVLSHVIRDNTNADDNRDHFLSNDILLYQRPKRDTNITNAIEELKPKKKSKLKRSKSNKSVVVTKFKLDGDIYALKVKETNTLNVSENVKDTIATCQVYSIKKSYPCDSPEGDMLLAVAKRKANKRKTKKVTTKTQLSSTTDKAKVVAAAFKKREVDSSHVMSDTFMPSVEELY